MDDRTGDRPAVLPAGAVVPCCTNWQTPKETYTHTTCIHWGMIRPSAFKPLYENGVPVLSDDFWYRNGKWDVNYELCDAVSAYCASHDAWKDFESGLVLSMVDIVCNSVPVDRIAATLEPLAKDPNRAEVMDLFTHGSTSGRPTSSASAVAASGTSPHPHATLRRSSPRRAGVHHADSDGVRKAVRSGSGMSPAADHHANSFLLFCGTQPWHALRL